jgi:hypothetical protein
MLSVLLDYLKREEFKRELKDALAPIMSVLADEARPYLAYVAIVLGFHFALLLCICFYLIKLKQVYPSILTVTSAALDRR